MKSIETLTERLRAQTERLQKNKEEVERLTRERYLALPALFGLASIDELITSLMDYASADLRQRGIAPTQQSNAETGRRVRGGTGKRYSAELREKIKREMIAGDTVAQISKKHGVPSPTLFMWRSRWGLTNHRAKKKDQKMNGGGQLDAIDPNKRYTVKEAAEQFGWMEGKFRAWYAQPGNIEVIRETQSDQRMRCYFLGSELIKARERLNGSKTIEA